MKKLILLLALIISSFYSVITLAQPNSIEWQHCYGGAAAESISDILPAADGGYYLIATSSSSDGDVTNNHGSADGIVMKTDALGNLVWVKNYGGSLWDEFTKGAITSDGGLVIVGHTDSQDGDIQHPLNTGQDIWLVKLDSQGNIEWEKTYGNNHYDAASSIIITNDNHYVLCGHSTVDVPWTNAKAGLIMKIAADGEELWRQTYNFIHNQYLNDIIETQDGNYMACGHLEYHPSYMTSVGGVEQHMPPDAWLVTVSPQGETIWDSLFDDPGEQGLYSLEETSNGDIISVGYSTHIPELNDNPENIRNGWLIYLNTAMNEVSYQLINTPSNSELRHIHMHNDGKIFTCGRYGASNTQADGWLIRLDEYANIVWQHQFGNAPGETAGAFIINTDESCTLSGWSSSVTPEAPSCYESTNFWIVKLSSIVNINEADSFTFSLYPNPATNNITINNIEKGSSITIHDIAGKLFHQSVINDVQTTIDTKHLSSGVYTVQVKNDNRVATQKLVIDK